MDSISLAECLQVATQLLPGTPMDGATIARGQFHDVVLVEGVAAVRIARRGAAGRQLARRTTLVTALAAQGLPFAVPTPVGEVMTIDGHVAVATHWISGSPSPRGTGDPGELRRLMDALRSIPVDAVALWLDEPHAYAGRGDWYPLMVDEVIPRLDASVRDEARRRVETAQALPDVEPSPVHGDLAGDNLRYDANGRLAGVLDWDLAQAFDPAVDAACLAWHGWDNVEAAVDAETFRRARIWAETFGIEQVGAAITNDEPPDVIADYVERASGWLVG